MAFIIDCSVVCGWLIQSQATSYSQAIATLMQSEAAFAPALLPMEYSNVLRSACRKGKLSAQDAQSAIAALKQLPIEIDATTPDAAVLLSLALRFDLSTYDAVYLELALRKQLRIATQDRALAEAAQLAGVGLVALSKGSV